MADCKICANELSRRNKSGYCRKCNSKSPESKLWRSRLMRERWREPTSRRILTECGTRNLLESGGQQKGTAIAKERETWKIASQFITQEARNRATRNMQNKKLEHIPREWRDLYHDLTRKKKMLARDASTLVLDHHDAEMRKFRRKIIEANNGSI